MMVMLRRDLGKDQVEEIHRRVESSEDGHVEKVFDRGFPKTSGCASGGRLFDGELTAFGTRLKRTWEKKCGG